MLASPSDTGAFGASMPFPLMTMLLGMEKLTFISSASNMLGCGSTAGFSVAGFSAVSPSDVSCVA
jgi:hypothetical protein